MNNPYSQCDAKGRCIHHPTFQLKTKKLGGGWKTLTTICSLCAYESFSKTSTASSSSSSCRPVRARCDDEIARNGEWSVGGASIDQSILSAPATYHRMTLSQHICTSHGHHGGGSSTPRRQQCGGHDRHHYRHHQAEPSMSSPRPCAPHHTHGLEEQFSKLSHRHHHTEQDSIDGSSDVTAEISYRSSGSRNSHTSSISSPSNSSSQRGIRNFVESPNNNQEEYVCGMEFDNGQLYYTGQIDNRSQLPHGLGTLRDNHDRILLEGEWHNGTLVAPTATTTTTLQQQQQQQRRASSSPHQVPPSSAMHENEYDSHPETEDEVDNDTDDDDNNDDNSSISSNALSVTYSSSTRSSTGMSSRFAETKKSSLPPPTMNCQRVRRVRWTEPHMKHYQTEDHHYP